MNHCEVIGMGLLSILANDLEGRTWQVPFWLPFRLCRLMYGGGYAPPKAAGLVWGCALVSALRLEICWAKAHQGRSPKCKTHLYRAA